MTTSIYELMYNWVAYMLGTSVAESARGIIFCEYAGYIMVAVIIIGTFKVLKYFLNCFSFR